MKKIKWFYRFAAVLLLLAFSGGTTWAGTGGYGRRNINTIINRRVKGAPVNENMFGLSSQELSQYSPNTSLINVLENQMVTYMWNNFTPSQGFNSYGQLALSMLNAINELPANSELFAATVQTLGGNAAYFSSDGCIWFGGQALGSSSSTSCNGNLYGPGDTASTSSNSNFSTQYITDNSSQFFYVNGRYWSGGTCGASSWQGGSDPCYSSVLAQAQQIMGSSSYAKDGGGSGALGAYEGMYDNVGIDWSGSATVSQTTSTGYQYIGSTITTTRSQVFNHASTNFNNTGSTHTNFSSNLINGKVHSLSGHSLNNISSHLYTTTINPVNYNLFGYNNINTNTNTTNNYQNTVKTANIAVTEDWFVSPIVLDMKGTGVLEASHGLWLPHPYHVAKKHLALFDWYGDGFPVAMEWVGPDDGLLVYLKPGDPRSGNCTLTHINGTCLMGTSSGYTNGFQELSTFDKKNNGVLTGNELKGFYVWQDKNQNGKVDPGELESVQQLGISAIYLQNNDFTGIFVMKGVAHRFWDWFPNIANIELLPKTQKKENFAQTQKIN